MKFKNGDVYEGSWENDKQNGIGIMKYANGKIEVGHWENNKKIK